MVVTGIAHKFVKYNKYLDLIVFTAIFSHQVRDSERRGFWFWPIGSTYALNKVTIYFLYFMTVITVSHFVRTRKMVKLPTKEMGESEVYEIV